MSMNEEMRGSSGRMSGLKKRLQTIEEALKTLKDNQQSLNQQVQTTRQAVERIEGKDSLKAMHRMRQDLDNKIEAFDELKDEMTQAARVLQSETGKMRNQIDDASDVLKRSSGVPEEIRRVTEKNKRTIVKTDLIKIFSAAILSSLITLGAAFYLMG